MVSIAPGSARVNSMITLFGLPPTWPVVLLGFFVFRVFDVVKLPEEVDIVAVNTMVKHELGGSAYRDRVAECSAAASAIGVESLRDANLRQLDRVKDPVAKMRARHVITEDARVEEFQRSWVRPP